MKPRNIIRRTVPMLLCIIMLCGMLPSLYSADGQLNHVSAGMEVGSDRASLSYAAERDAVAVAALFYADTGRMRPAGVAEVDAGSGTVTIQLQEVRCESDELRAFLLDRESGAPLGTGRPLGEDEDHTVIFWRNDGTVGAESIQIVKHGAEASPPEDPALDGCLFTGWYEEKGAVTLFDFSTPIDHDTFLYAGWEDEDGELSACYDEEQTENSITEVEMRGAQAAVTISSNQRALITVEFLEDTYGQEDAQEKLIGSVCAATPDLCEQEVLLMDVDLDLPEYYIIRVTMTDGGETELCSPLQSIEYTAVYEEYAAKTTEDFPEDRVVNFDESEEENFGVLSDRVRIITDTAEMTYEDIYDENGYLEEQRFTGYIVKNPGEETLGLQSGEIVLFYNEEGLPMLFAVGSVQIDGDGNAVLTEDEDPEFSEIYDYLKVDLWTASDREEDAGLTAEIVDVDGTLLELNLNPGVDWRPKNGAFHLKVNGSIGIRGEIKMLWDAHLFRDDYFEFSHKTVTKVSADVELLVDNDYSEEEDGPKKSEIYSIPILKKEVPTKIPGLTVGAEAKIPLELTGKIGLGFHYESESTSGVVFNSDSGTREIREKEQTLEVDYLEGEVEISFGPEISISLKFLNDWMKAEVTASGGVKITVTGDLGTQVETAGSQYVHACTLCFDLELKWFLEATIKVTLNVPNVKKLQGTLLDMTVFKCEGPISFFGSLKDGKAYWSVINSADSVFHGRDSGLRAGSCPNKRFRTGFEILGSDGTTIAGTAISVRRQDGTEVSSKNTPCHIFLYPGVYTASAIIEDKKISKTFTVGTEARTVSLSSTSADASMEGTVRYAADGNPLSGVKVTAAQNGEVICATKTDDNGMYSLAVPSGKIVLTFEKNGYNKDKLYCTLTGGEKANGDIYITSGSDPGGLKGSVLDVNGALLAGATVKIRSGANNTSEGHVLKTLKTKDDGSFAFPSDESRLFMGFKPGNYTVCAMGSGGRAYHTVVVIAGGIADVGEIRLEYSGPEVGDVGSAVTFGSYEQDSDLADGPEPILWRVLAIENGRALLISTKGLDCKPYNDETVDVTWETCTIRKWLNDEFFAAAFDVGEQSIIARTTVTAEDNLAYGTDAGNDTLDRVFLLSISEAERYFDSDIDRMCFPTAYSEDKGCFVNEFYDDTCWWWLRSPGNDSNVAAGVDGGGSVFESGDHVSAGIVTVRPALWINL